MLREPGSLYYGKRHGSCLKVKSFYDAEAKVIGLTVGEVCSLASGPLPVQGGMCRLADAGDCRASTAIRLVHWCARWSLASNSVSALA